MRERTAFAISMKNVLDSLAAEQYNTKQQTPIPAIKSLRAESGELNAECQDCHAGYANL
jgi:hypothetical protein